MPFEARHNSTRTSDAPSGPGARGEDEPPGRAPHAEGGGADEAGADETEDREEEGESATSSDARGRTARPRSFWKELPLLVVVALVLALLIKTFLVQAFSIPSASMENTLQIGDRVMVDKLTPWFGAEPARGEVVVFHDPDGWLENEPTPTPNPVQRVFSWIGLMPSANDKDLIKRVIGVGGDTIECRGTGPLMVNGKPLHDTFIYAGNTPCTNDDTGGQFKVTVPKGKIWVMGDHRQNSLDSRYHQSDRNHGFVPVSNVIGRAFIVAWPPTHWATLPVPGTFDHAGVSAAASAAPAALGLTGAVPLVLWRRRRVTARAARVSGGGTPG